MLTEYQLTQGIAALQAEYHEKRTAGESAESLTGMSNTLAGLRDQLSALLAEGAKLCPACGQAPHGMKRHPGLYEVGCLSNLVDGHPSLRAQGETADEAVAKWNALEA